MFIIVSIAIEGSATVNSTGEVQAINVGDIRTWDCGDSGGNVIATLKDNMTLIVSGIGAMADYNYSSVRYKQMAPWYNIKNNITNVVIEYGVTSIGSDAFYGFSRLTSVTIPNSVKFIKTGAFLYCSTMTSVTIPYSVRYIGLSAFAVTGLTSVVIPDSVYDIAAGAFSDCKNLAVVKIGNRVRSIREGTFYGCINLTSITIPKRVEEIEYEAFIDCMNLMSIIVQNPKPPYGGKDWVFGSNDKNKNENYFSRTCLYVPANSINVYSVADGWKDFKCIKPLEAAPMGRK
jgi:hypothetical protein